MRAVQPEEGEPPPPRGGDGAAHQAARARAAALHQACDTAASRRLEALPARALRLDGGRLSTSGFTCAVCGEYHAERPLDIRYDLPDAVFALSDPERADRADILDDFCRLQNGEARYFVRGLLELPIQGTSSYFGYGIWIETTQEAIERLGESWHDEDANLTEHGFLANELEPYPGSGGLKVTLQTRKTLPTVLVDEGHALTDDQRAGISDERANELAASILH